MAGILAADPLSEPRYRGLAYAAKLAFYDLGATSVQEWISAPVGLDSRYIPPKPAYPAVRNLKSSPVSQLIHVYHILMRECPP